MRNYDSVFHVISADNKIWFGSSVDDSVRCLDASSGQLKWIVTTDGPVRLAPTWADQRIYFGSDDGYARCVDASTGESIWKFSPREGTAPRRVLHNGKLIASEPCRTGVVVEDGTAWFACSMLPWRESYLCALNSRTGTATTPDHFVKTLRDRTMEGAPALSSAALIFPQGRVAPRVFDRDNGDDLGAMAKSGGGSVVVVSLDDTILHGPASDPRKGGFRRSGGESREMVAALGRGNALVVDGADSWMLTDDAIIASSLTSDSEGWEVACDCPFAMIKAGGTLFVGGDGRVAAYSASDGRRVWQQPAEGRVFGLVAAGGRLFANTDAGTIHCYAVGGSANTRSLPVSVEPTESKRKSALQVDSVKDKRLLGHWALQHSVAAGNRISALHGPQLTLESEPRFAPLGDYEALELDGSKETLMVAPSFREAPHPTTAFTAAAWVRVDKLHDWGGIIGIVQDDGSEENGWLLGFRKNKFCVAVRSAGGPGNLTYLTSDSTFELSQWRHVVGSYDGQVMRLYVDGQQCAESKQQSGAIVYPERAWFEIGAYHDKNEYFRLCGGLHEVRLYDQALSAAEVAAQYDVSKSRIPVTIENAEIKSGPWLTFNDATSATVRWSTETPQPTRLEFGTTQLDRRVEDPAPRTEHEAVLRGLDRHRLYHYRIIQTLGAETRRSESFECDNFFNFSLPSKERITWRPAPEENGSKRGDESSSASRLKDDGAAARWMLAEAGAERGLCLLIGEPSAALVAEMARGSQMRIVIASSDPGYVARGRANFLEPQRQIYGNQLTIHEVDDLGSLPFPESWANLVVVGSSGVPEEVAREAMRMTRPEGGVALVLGDASAETPRGFSKVAGPSGRSWMRYRKPRIAGAGEWSHLYGKPDNSAFGGEELSGARSREELQVQWIGRPGPRYQADRSGRKPSPLAVGGRLFLQGLHRIIAVDAFNGSILWSVEIPGLERFNMPRDCSNWCAGRDCLLVAVKSECWKISMKTGEVLQRIAVADGFDGGDDPDGASGFDEPMDWGYVASINDRVFGSAVRQGTSWTSFWGGGDAGWYDATSGSVTHPICSDAVFCRDASSMEILWKYQRGVVLNPTITLSDSTMYFVESRSPRVLAGAERRVNDPQLWSQLYLVALDAETGKPQWEKRLPAMDPQVVLYLAHASDQLTLVSSSAKKSYRVKSLRSADGSERWATDIPWPGGHGDHGKAMMRPAIVGNRVFIRPNVLSLDDGTVLPAKMPNGHGCGTYACTTNAIFYRAKTVTMWDPQSDVKSTWARLRPDCWLSTIPACGMLLSPEGGGGCSCGQWMETSIGFMPRAARPVDREEGASEMQRP